MSYPELPTAAELAERLGVAPSTILRATWHRYGPGGRPSRWTVQVQHDPTLMRLLDLHPWEEVSTERFTTWTVTMPDLDLVFCIQHKPTRTVKNG